MRKTFPALLPVLPWSSLYAAPRPDGAYRQEMGRLVYEAASIGQWRWLGPSADSKPLPKCRLPADAKLFPRPPRCPVFDADCQAAGITKTAPRGRVVDIHPDVHRDHTSGTHLSASGVRPRRTAMAAMRHSRIELTMNYYTDPVLLDVAGAMNSLPNFSSGQGDTAKRTAKGA